MDIKSKSSHKKKVLAISVLLVSVIVTMASFPYINRECEKIFLNKMGQEDKWIDKEFLCSLYVGCYVLYMEAMERENGISMRGSEIFIEEYPQYGNKYEIDLYVDEIIDEWDSYFEEYRKNVDYCVIGNTDPDNSGEPDVFSNTSRDLRKALSDSSLVAGNGKYEEIFKIRFNENGVMEVDVYYTHYGNGVEDEIIKYFGRMDRKGLVEMGFQGLFEEYPGGLKLKKPKNFEVIFATVRDNSGYTVVENSRTPSYQYWRFGYREAGANLLFAAVLIFLVLFSFFMGSRRVWKEDVMVQRPGRWYLMETALISALSVFAMVQSGAFFGLIWEQNYNYNLFASYKSMSIKEIYDVILPIVQCGLSLLITYAIWYASICFIRPVFVLGIREYIRQYSLIYQIFPLLKKLWKRFMYEVKHINFAEKSTNVIVKIVLVNFVILSLISVFWVFGIIPIAVYSLVLFYLIKKNYDKIRKDYRVLLQGVNRIADGDLNMVLDEDLGVFEPFRNELSKIRDGFQKAVDNEVKSQRMKTDLITNVSHDLKTPLTAISTYIELLKTENITEEERRSYIDTLEKKSIRLRILIEDLFEVSRASSNNIVLDLMDLDVVNLVKQVSIEHVEKMQERGLELRWNIPQEKVMVRLDNQKTYRIFENLFGNICKYAMPNSRVYVSIREVNNSAEIILKNISGEELNISADEITDRFVRGDSSRNTEGSGLGLAIAKSLAQAQGGTFTVEIDGDLFKVIICFSLV